MTTGVQLSANSSQTHMTPSSAWCIGNRARVAMAQTVSVVVHYALTHPLH